VAEYLSVAEAREQPGLRLVLSVGVPGPWGEAAKALFHGRLAGRYGYAPERAEAAPARVVAILELLGRQLTRRRERGRRFLVGETLSALDLYWAAFAAMLEPLPPELCPMPEPMRHSYRTQHPAIRAASDPALLAHRDFVYREYLELLLDF
jgi:glutathione S-transferase